MPHPALQDVGSHRFSALSFVETTVWLASRCEELPGLLRFGRSSFSRPPTRTLPQSQSASTQSLDQSQPAGPSFLALSSPICFSLITWARTLKEYSVSLLGSPLKHGTPPFPSVLTLRWVLLLHEVGRAQRVDEGRHGLKSGLGAQRGPGAVAPLPGRKRKVPALAQTDLLAASPSLSHGSCHVRSGALHLQCCPLDSYISTAFVLDVVTTVAVAVQHFDQTCLKNKFPSGHSSNGLSANFRASDSQCQTLWSLNPRYKAYFCRREPQTLAEHSQHEAPKNILQIEKL